MGDILTISFFRNMCPKQWPLGCLCDVSIDIDMYIYIYTCWCMFILNIWAHTHTYIYIYIHIFEKDRLVFSVNCTVSLSPTVNSWYMHLCNWLFAALCIYIYIYIYIYIHSYITYYLHAFSVTGMNEIWLPVPSLPVACRTRSCF